MLISIVNKTNGSVSDEELQQVIRAINRQINEDFAPYWHLRATLRLEGHSEEDANTETPDELRGDAILFLCKESNVASALGYHENNKLGIPYGFVSTDLSQSMGEHWSVTLSHESLELLADAAANLLVRGPHPDDPNREVFHWFEMCDAVQGEQYEIDGVAVSNFVLPLYFKPAQAEAKIKPRLDFLSRAHGENKVPLKPFNVNPGGYIGYYDPETKISETFSAPADAKAMSRLALKGAATGVTRGSRRKAPISAPVEAGLAPAAKARIKVRKTKAPAIAAVPAAQTAAATPTAWTPIKVADLKPGDILLSRGTSWLARAIETFDGHEISHAALYIGDGNLGEATREGVKLHTLVYSAEDDEWVRARRPKDSAIIGDVLQKAKSFIAADQRYAYEQIVLLGMLALTRRIPFTPSVGVVVRRILDSAAEALNRVVSAMEAQKKEPMICSEFVFRCFDETHPGSIRFGATDAAGQPLMARREMDSKRGHGIERGSVLHTLSEKGVTVKQSLRLAIRANAELPLEQLVRQYLRETGANLGEDELEIDPSLEASIVCFAAAQQRAAGAGTTVRAARSESAIERFMATARDFVTPSDLLFSPSLTSVGQLLESEIHPTNQAAFARAWKRLRAE